MCASKVSVCPCACVCACEQVYFFMDANFIIHFITGISMVLKRTNWVDVQDVGISSRKQRHATNSAPETSSSMSFGSSSSCTRTGSAFCLPFRFPFLLRLLLEDML